MFWDGLGCFHGPAWKSQQTPSVEKNLLRYLVYTYSIHKVSSFLIIISTQDGGGVMLLVHKDIPHMPLLDNDSESVWVKLFVNKKTHFVASWYRPHVDGHLPVSDNENDLLNSMEKFDNLFREQLDKIKNINKGNEPPLNSRFR